MTGRDLPPATADDDGCALEGDKLTVAPVQEGRAAQLGERESAGNINECGMFATDRQAIVAHANVHRIAHGSVPDNLNLGPVDQAHFHQAA